MWTETCAMLVMEPPYQGMVVFLPDREAHLLYLFATLCHLVAHPVGIAPLVARSGPRVNIRGDKRSLLHNSERYRQKVGGISLAEGE